MEKLIESKNFPNRFFGKLQKMEMSRIVVLLILMLVGCTVIILSLIIDEHEYHIIKLILEHLGSLMVIIAPIDLLRSIFIETDVTAERHKAVKEVIEEVINQNLHSKDTFESTIKRIASEVILEQQSTYSIFKRCGIQEVTTALDITKLLNEMSKLSNCKIRINVIFLPYCDRVSHVLHDCIVKRNCQLELVLCDPSLRDALESRRIAVNPDLSPGYYPRMIKDNIREMNHLFNMLPPHLKQNMTVKKHRSFIGASMWGYADTYWIGSYLSGRMATDGTNIKIKGYDSFLFQEYRSHFKFEWKNAKTIIGGELIYDLN